MLKRIQQLSLLFLLPVILIAGCQDEQAQKAKELAHQFIIVDTHVDVPYRLRSEWEDISQATEDGDFDYPRAKEGGLDAPFMSIYIPARFQENGGAKTLADSLIDMINKIADDHPDKFAVATSPADVKKQFEDGLISLPMGMENGAPIEGDLKNVKYFYDRGIRYITLTHSKDNHISDSSYDTLDTHGGLSPFGEQVVQEMNSVGIMIDVSHISDSAFYDVMRITEAPVIASHSSCRHFTPGWERNMGDDMIRRLGENGGVLMINFGSNFLDEESRQSPRGEKYVYSDVSRVADHIDRVVELAGIDHVGLGSDFDGVGDTLPVGLKDVSEYPNLIKELLNRGYTEEEIQKICSGNIFRVWNQVLEMAQN